jgi:hypothetical protein
VEAGFSLEHAQFFEGAVKGALEAGVMAREAIGKGIEQVDAGLEDVDAAEIPGGGDEFVEEGLLERAARLDFGLVVSLQLLEGCLFFGLDDELLGGEAVFQGILRTAGFTFFSARAGAELRVGAIGF